MADLTGKAFVWGITNLGRDSAGTATSLLVDPDETTTTTIAAVCVFQSFDFSRESEVSDLQNESGDTVGRAYFNKKQTAKITVVPAGASIAAAEANAALLLPEPGSKISSFGDGDVSAISGNWAVLRSNFSRTNIDKMAIDLELEKFEANDITAAIS